MNPDTFRDGRPQHSVIGLNEERPLVVMDQNPQKDDSSLSFDMHYELEMGVILEGSMERRAGNESHVCEAGDIWFCGMWEPHGYRASASCHRVVFAIWPPLLRTLSLPEAPDLHWMQPFVAPPEYRPRVPKALRDDVIELVHWHFGRTQCMGAARKRMLLMELLLFLFENNLVKHTGGDTAAESNRMHQITPAIELAFARNDLVTIEEAAQVCGLSRDVFIRSFQRLMGISFSKFALRHRLSRAAAQLVETDKPIKAIAHEWGFTDESHLHRLFKQHYDRTPLSYRRDTA